MELSEIKSLAIERLHQIKEAQYKALYRDGGDGTRQVRLDSIQETSNKIAELSRKTAEK